MAGKSCGGQTVTDKKIEARILSVFMDARPWQAVHKERKICRSALEGQMTGCWDNAEYALYCHGCGALSEFQHIFMFLMPCALRRAFLFPKFGDNRYHLIYSFITVFII